MGMEPIKAVAAINFHVSVVTDRLAWYWFLASPPSLVPFKPCPLCDFFTSSGNPLVSIPDRVHAPVLDTSVAGYPHPATFTTLISVANGEYHTSKGLVIKRLFTRHVSPPIPFYPVSN
jgi:hypothetical protein